MKLLGNFASLSVLLHLHETAGGESARRIAQLVGLSHNAVNAALVRLERYGLVHSTRIGRAYSYVLNREHLAIARGIGPLFSTLQNWKAIIGTYYLDVLRIHPLSILLFGSLARGDYRPESDMDLLFIFSDVDDRPDRLDEVLRHTRTVRQLCGHTPTPILMGLTAFQTKAKTKESFVTNIVREGQCIAGATPTELLYP